MPRKGHGQFQRNAATAGFGGPPEARIGTQFKPGKSGNPGGLTKETRALQAAHRAYCLEHLPKAALLHVSVIDEAIRRKDAGQPPDEYPKDWQRSVEYLTHYGVGKPKESVELTGADGGPVQVVDYSALSEDELLIALELQRKAMMTDAPGEIVH